MKKLLSILGSVGMIGTAGATVVACGNNNKPKEDTKDEVAGKLEADIQEAEGLINTNKKEASVKEALQTAVNKAKETFNNKDATVEQLKTASSDLRKAIEVYNQSPNDPKEAAKTALANLIKEAQGLVEANEKEDSAVQKLDSATKAARKVLEEPKSSTIDLTNATTKLQEEIKKYKTAKPKDERTPKDKLQDKITEANRLIVLGEKSDEAIKALKSEIQIAQAALDKKDVKDDELISALNKLQTAISVYNNSAEGIGAWLSRLEKQIDAAQVIGAIKGRSKTKAERDAFNKVIDKAKNVLANSKDENQVKAMIEELKKAIDEF